MDHSRSRGAYGGNRSLGDLLLPGGQMIFWLCIILASSLILGAVAMAVLLCRVADDLRATKTLDEAEEATR